MAQQTQEELYNEEQEQQQINEEYKIWKKNTPLLYDMAITYELDWPSLTVQWLPNKLQVTDQNYDIHKLILGTHTSGVEPNYLMIAKVRLPNEKTQTDFINYQTNNKDVGGLGIATGENKLDYETKILHDEEVNRARYMPQKFNVIASKCKSGEVHVFDFTHHKAKPDSDSIVKPQLRLLGHSQEGFGLNWSTLKDGLLLSGSNDNKICLWDINQATELNSTINPCMEFNSHLGPVGDVCWHKFRADLFGSVSDDRNIFIWDIKDSPKSPVCQIQAHLGEIYSIDFNPLDENIFITASADKTVVLWDLRQTSKKLHTFESHNDEVIKVEFSSFNVGLFGSCGADRRVMIWDISKIGAPQGVEDAQDGPPELLFIHGGHRAKVLDFSWNPNEQLVIASVEEENNFLQIWQMASNIYKDDQLQDMFGNNLNDQ